MIKSSFWQNIVVSIRYSLHVKRKTELWNVVPVYYYCTDLFNLRGSDIEYNPVFFAYAVVTLDNIL